MNSTERHKIRYQRRNAARIAKRNAQNKKYDNYNNVLNPQNIYRAYLKTAHTINWKLSCQLYGMNIVQSTYDIIDTLQKKEIVTDGYRTFVIMERGKLRHIQSPSIREKVTQKTLCSTVLKPILTRPLIYDNGASLENKGVNFARKRLVHHLTSFYRNNGSNGFILLIDMHGYFNSLDHETIMRGNCKYIHDPYLRQMIARYISLSGMCGVGIGSEISQIEAVFYANPIDHYIKDRLGMKYYGRYMDDAYIISDSRQRLEYCLKEITRICGELKLTLNDHKVKILPLSKGFTYMKTRYLYSATGKIIKCGGKESAQRERRKIKAFGRNVTNGEMTINQAENNHKSWRKSMIKYFNCWKYIQSTDELYREVFNDIFQRKRSCHTVFRRIGRSGEKRLRDKESRSNYYRRRMGSCRRPCAYYRR